MGAQLAFKSIDSSPRQGSMANRIAQLQKLHADFNAKPVTGSYLPLRRVLYKILRSTFNRQQEISLATIKLIEAMCNEVERTPVTPQSKSAVVSFDAATSSASAASLKVFEPPKVAETGMSSAGQLQDQAKINNVRPLTGFNSVYSAPAELRMTERVALYSLVFSLQPRNCLEVGTFRGGSTAIICGAMDDTGWGQLACVDPAPKVDPQLWSGISHRCRMYTGLSPAILPQIVAETGAQFDFAWIDGNHYYESVRADIAGLLEHLADQAYVLFHDAHSAGVKQAIDEAVKTIPSLTDCGLISVEPTILNNNGASETWAGMRLLRYQR